MILFFSVGDSAGGNMAAALALKLRTMTETVPRPKLQVRLVKSKFVVKRLHSNDAYIFFYFHNYLIVLIIIVLITGIDLSYTASSRPQVAILRTKRRSSNWYCRRNSSCPAVIHGRQPDICFRSKWQLKVSLSRNCSKYFFFSQNYCWEHNAILQRRQFVIEHSKYLKITGWL